jgi:hypothetical protein
MKPKLLLTGGGIFTAGFSFSENKKIFSYGNGRRIQKENCSLQPRLE